MTRFPRPLPHDARAMQGAAGATVRQGEPWGGTDAEPRKEAHNPSRAKMAHEGTHAQPPRQYFPPFPRIVLTLQLRCKFITILLGKGGEERGALVAPRSKT